MPEKPKKREQPPAGMNLFDLDVDKISPHAGKRRKKGEPLPKLSIQEKFDAWIATHPEVEALTVRFSRELLAAGRRKYGMKAIAERIRWHYAIQQDTVEEWKLCNNYTSRLARYIMNKYPDLDGFYDLRPLREEGAPSEREEDN